MPTKKASEMNDSEESSFMSDFQSEQEEIDEIVLKERLRQQKVENYINWGWFAVTTPIWLVVIMWVVAKAEWPLGILAFLSFLMVRELRGAISASIGTQGQVICVLMAQIKTLQKALKIDPEAPISKDDQWWLKKLENQTNRAKYQVLIESTLIGLMFLIYLVGDHY